MRKLLTPILIVGLAIASFFWYTKPAWDSTSGIQEEIQEYDSALSQVNQIQEIRDNLLSRYNSLPDSTLFILNEVMPRSIDQVQFLIELNQIANANGLSVQDIAFTDQSSNESGSSGSDDSEEEEKPYKTTLVSFTTSGPYEDVLSFIGRVEQSARLIDIVALDVSVESENPSGPEQQTSGSETLGPTGQNNTYQIGAMTYSLRESESSQNSTSTSASGGNSLSTQPDNNI